MKDNIYPRFFNAQDLGKTFREVAVDVIRTEYQDVINRWYHSNKDADLFVWFDSDKNIIKQQLSFYGQVIEWNVIEGVRTGCVLEEEDPALVDKRRATDVIQFDQRPQASSLKQAVDLLKNITVLREEDRQILLENFSSEHRTAQSMDPEEFVRRFGSALNRRAKTRRSLLDRFLAWLTRSR